MTFILITTFISLFINGILLSYCQRLRIERKELKDELLRDGKVIGELLEQLEKR
jgi:hypothetical protein